MSNIETISKVILQETCKIKHSVSGYNDDETTNADLYAMWMHVRALLSLHLKMEDGEGLVKGNRPILQEQYERWWRKKTIFADGQSL